MPESQSECPLCLKPKSRTGGGFFTQFIDVCLCDAANQIDETSYEICTVCHKRIDRGRGGSLTQWIFKPAFCSCQSPVSVQPDAAPVELEVAAGDLLADAPELELDAANFPRQRYKAILELGRGASGSVYLCLDRQLQKKVAVKVLHKITGEQLIRFQQEAKAISRLSHPGIVKIIDFGPTQSGQPFMVLEFVDGISLQRHLRERGTLSERQFINLFPKLCDALTHAHDSNIYHRDLKPSNIIVSDTADGDYQIRIIDFGVARVKFENQDLTIFQGRTMAGTPAYMPPDQGLDYDYDARSEIYSLGCVMFETLTGRPPFLAESALEILTMHARMPPPLLADVGGRQFSDALEEIVQRCLAKDPDERPADMQEVKVLLSDLLQTTEAGENSPELEDLPVSPETVVKSKIVVGSLLALTTFLLLVLAWSLNSSPAIMPKMNDGLESSYIGALDYQTRPASTSAGDRETITHPATNHDSSTQASGSLAFNTKSATTGNATVHNAIEDRMLAGMPGLTEDPDYLKRAKEGDTIAQSALGNRYFKQKDYENAMLWYRKAADGGDSRAQVFVGHMFEGGLGVDRDFKKAMFWFQKAMKSHRAQYKIGNMYLKGHGVPRDYQAALKWFLLASKADNHAAQMEIGRMYERGLGVERDQKKAIKWYRLAAETNKAARRNLQRLEKAGYEEGPIVEQDD